VAPLVGDGYLEVEDKVAGASKSWQGPTSAIRVPWKSAFSIGKASFDIFNHL